MQGEPAIDDWLQASRSCAREGRHALGAEWARRVLDCGEGPHSGEALALLALHELRLGDLRACMASGQAAATRLQAPAQAALLARAECTLAVACMQAELVQQGLVHIQLGTAAAALAGDPMAMAWCRCRLAQAHTLLGDTGHARSLFEQAFDDAVREGDTELQFSILYNQAWPWVDQSMRGTLQDASRLQGALGLLERAQSLADADGNVHSQGICLLNRSRCLQGLNRPMESRPLAEQALALGQAHRLTQLIIGAQTVLAEWMLREDRAEEALQVLLSVRVTVSEADLLSQLDLLRPIVAAHRQLRQFEAALDTFGELHTVALRQARARADLQAWMLIHQREMDREREAAQRAQLDAEVERLRAARWEAEAHHDALTGLANRRFVTARLPGLLTHGQTSGQPLLAAMLDLDHFKSINDRFGHEVGDAVLRATGAILRDHVRPRDTPARLGGEEFLLLLPDTDLESAVAACERLRRSVAEHPWTDMAHGLVVTVSIGLGPVEATEAPWLAADAALYRAKAGGRNRVAVAASGQAPQPN